MTRVLLDTNAYSRLMDLATEAKDWSDLATNATRYLAVNPLVAAPHRSLGEAGEQLGQPQTAVAAYRTLLLLAPPDPSAVSDWRTW